MVELTIHMREGSINLWYFRSIQYFSTFYNDYSYYPAKTPINFYKIFKNFVYSLTKKIMVFNIHFAKKLVFSLSISAEVVCHCHILTIIRITKNLKSNPNITPNLT